MVELLPLFCMGPSHQAIHTNQLRMDGLERLWSHLPIQVLPSNTKQGLRFSTNQSSLVASIYVSKVLPSIMRLSFQGRFNVAKTKFLKWILLIGALGCSLLLRKLKFLAVNQLPHSFKSKISQCSTSHQVPLTPCRRTLACR